jgi:hypothetical protein
LCILMSMVAFLKLLASLLFQFCFSRLLYLMIYKLLFLDKRVLLILSHL